MGAWGVIRESAGSAERRRDRKKPAGTGGMFSRAWLHFGRAALERPFLEHFTAFLDPFDRSFFPLYRPFSVSFSVAPLREASPFKRGAADNIRISRPYLFPAFLNPGMATGRGRSAGAFPRIKGRTSGYAAPFQGRPTAASSGGGPFSFSPSIPCQRRKIATVGKEEAEIAAAPVPAMEAVG